METNEIFENLIKIEPKVVSIETLFNNEDTLKNTKYDPAYQRNYVWDDEKATYFFCFLLFLKIKSDVPVVFYRLRKTISFRHNLVYDIGPVSEFLK